MYEINQSSLDRVYDQLSGLLDELGKARRHGDVYMAQCIRESVDNLHKAAEEMEAALAARYAA